jgi:hypothetical protein
MSVTLKNKIKKVWYIFGLSNFILSLLSYFKLFSFPLGSVISIFGFLFTTIAWLFVDAIETRNTREQYICELELRVKQLESIKHS